MSCLQYVTKCTVIKGQTLPKHQRQFPVGARSPGSNLMSQLNKRYCLNYVTLDVDIAKKLQCPHLSFVRQSDALRNLQLSAQRTWITNCHVYNSVPLCEATCCPLQGLKYCDNGVNIMSRRVELQLQADLPDNGLTIEDYSSIFISCYEYYYIHDILTGH